MTLRLNTASKYFVIGVSALVFSGAAHAASCSSMQKELGVMGQEIVSMQADRENVVSVFEIHNVERAAAKNELANVKTGLIKFTPEETKALEESVATHHEEAEAAKAKLDVLNTALMDKANVYNATSEKFNEQCIG
ncbi:hypothetical protein [Hirschia litorea]|uniref:Uncharacterized protein n=1 Tax=Hirschia litorea TaxID=1199156 RepID=A0ABW2IIP2_9PROT